MPELRRDPLTGRWVIIATERAKRPIDFAATKEQSLPPADCPFCAGREAQTGKEIFAVRDGGAHPGDPGWRVRVVPNIRPLLRIEGGLNRRARGMYDLMDGIGAHELIIETPEHVGNAADLPAAQLEAVVHACAQRIADLERDPRLHYVLWFKNYGAAAGAGQHQHARSQLIATPVTPKVVKEELVGARRYFEEKERCLICDVIRQEQEMKTRVVADAARMIAFCPFAGRFPFEVWIIPKRHRCDYAAMELDEQRELAVVLQRVLSRLKAVLQDPPYNVLLHTAPFRRERGKLGHWRTLEEDYHWHLELIPRLTRVAGFEWGSGFYINPTPPEEAAQYLRGTGEQ